MHLKVLCRDKKTNTEAIWAQGAETESQNQSEVGETRMKR